MRRARLLKDGTGKASVPEAAAQVLRTCGGQPKKMTESGTEASEDETTDGAVAAARQLQPR